MAGELVPVVMLPRYTVFAGKFISSDAGGGYTTIAMDVTEYQNAIINVWRNALLPNAGGATFKVIFEESTDQVSWSECATSPSGQDPGVKTEVQYTAALTRRWFRVRIELGGNNDAAVTCWAVGFLEQRLR